ncbi:peroxisome biogenesis protein 2-like [Primulina eburnea]|uniref:peroxisome biogenesis protein 2-like n=1 Tax=Primulina eburnea TaxID=1245227 RepID=UPI003C6C9BF8
MLGSIPTASFSFSGQLFPRLPGYRSLIERALKARLVCGSRHMNRSVSFEYMNRQLVWNEFSEMLLLLPLLNSSSVKYFLRPFSKDKSSSLERDEALCSIYQATPTTPFLALPCQHRYCYYCLRTRCSASSAFRCSSCNELVIAIAAWGYCQQNY